MTESLEGHLRKYLQNAPHNAIRQESFNNTIDALIAATRDLASKESLKQRWEMAIRAELLVLSVRYMYSIY